MYYLYRIIMLCVQALNAAIMIGLLLMVLAAPYCFWKTLSNPNFPFPAKIHEIAMLLFLFGLIFLDSKRGMKFKNWIKRIF